MKFNTTVAPNIKPTAEQEAILHAMRGMGPGDLYHVHGHPGSGKTLLGFLARQTFSQASVTHIAAKGAAETATIFGVARAELLGEKIINPNAKLVPRCEHRELAELARAVIHTNDPQAGPNLLGHPDLYRYLSGSPGVAHDIYLSAYAARLEQGHSRWTGGQLVIVDNAEGMDFAGMRILRAARRQGAMLLLTGDPHQSIHSRRGGGQGFADEPTRLFYLTQSFRLGGELAEAANSLLRRFSHAPAITPRAANLAVASGASNGQTAIIARSNFGAITAALAAREKLGRSSPVYMPGLREAFADLARLYAVIQGRASEEDRRQVALTWRLDPRRLKEDLQREMELISPAIAKLIACHGESVVSRLEREFADTPRVPLHAGTVHRLIGSEYREVILAPDFRIPEDKAGQAEVSQLLYVAVTRATHRIHGTARVLDFISPALGARDDLRLELDDFHPDFQAQPEPIAPIIHPHPLGPAEKPGAERTAEREWTISAPPEPSYPNPSYPARQSVQPPRRADYSDNPMDRTNSRSSSPAGDEGGIHRRWPPSIRQGANFQKTNSEKTDFPDRSDAQELRRPARATDFQKTDFQKTDFQKTDFQKTNFQKQATCEQAYSPTYSETHAEADESVYNAETHGAKTHGAKTHGAKTHGAKTHGAAPEEPAATPPAVWTGDFRDQLLAANLRYQQSAQELVSAMAGLLRYAEELEQENNFLRQQIRTLRLQSALPQVGNARAEPGRTGAPSGDRHDQNRHDQNRHDQSFRGQKKPAAERQPGRAAGTGL